MHQKNLFPDLLEKYLNNGLLPEEEQEFVNLLRQKRYRDWLSLDVLARLEDEHPELKTLPDDASQKMLQAIFSHGEEVTPRIPSRRRWMPYAAAAILLLAVGLYFYPTRQKQEAPVVTTTPVQQDVDPGGNKAILTLADGRKIVLDSAANGQLVNQDNAEVTKTKDGELTYNSSAAVSYNILNTPRGGQYMLTLPDGTKVWLNAASTIKFPTAFINKDRQVELSGEAYFEVAHNAKQPFYVNLKGMSVLVLGTHFNVNAYEDENAVKTTLLEGSVRIVNRETSNVNGLLPVLKPSQQAVFTHDSRLTIHDVPDAEEAIAWKNGLFIFSNENITSIMRKLARWYDIDVEYKGDVSGKSLWGTMSRFEKVSEVLKMLELTNVVNFSMEGRKIIVKPNQQ
jgi:ferric-dicitrate binding protein FerR (iron transport regulator)